MRIVGSTEALAVATAREVGAGAGTGSVRKHWPQNIAPIGFIAPQAAQRPRPLISRNRHGEELS